MEATELTDVQLCKCLDPNETRSKMEAELAVVSYAERGGIREGDI